jgi:hypothetical protein
MSYGERLFMFSVFMLAHAKTVMMSGIHPNHERTFWLWVGPKQWCKSTMMKKTAGIVGSSDKSVSETTPPGAADEILSSGQPVTVFEDIGHTKASKAKYTLDHLAMSIRACYNGDSVTVNGRERKLHGGMFGSMNSTAFTKLQALDDDGTLMSRVVVAQIPDTDEKLEKSFLGEFLKEQSAEKQDAAVCALARLEWDRFAFRKYCDFLSSNNFADERRRTALAIDMVYASQLIEKSKLKNGEQKMQEFVRRHFQPHLSEKEKEKHLLPEFNRLVKQRFFNADGSLVPWERRVAANGTDVIIQSKGKLNDGIYDVRLDTLFTELQQAPNKTDEWKQNITSEKKLRKLIEPQLGENKSARMEEQGKGRSGKPVKMWTLTLEK